jgi:hypothetical protein
MPQLEPGFLTADPQPGSQTTPKLMESTMNGRQFEPGETGSGDPARQHHAASPENRSAARLVLGQRSKCSTNKMLYKKDDTVKTWQQQVYPIRWLKRRYGLSQKFALLLAAEFRLGGL